MELNTQQLKAIDEMPVRELYVKLELLNWQEEPIKEIQGTLTGGNIQVNGNSKVRRTCSFTFVTLDEVEQFIELKSKFRLFTGLKNRLPQKYGVTDDIIWFKQGIYVFCDASFSHSANGSTVSVTAKDKMCLLNGDIAGQISDTVVLHEMELEDEQGEIYYEKILIFNIINEFVHHYGGEKMSSIFVSDVPLKIRQLMSYQGNRPIYMEVRDDGFYTGNYDWNPREGFKELVAGDQIGYTLVDFTYPGELIASPGDTVTSVLDKICNVLGNFEYYYDVDGNFRFQEIRNYLNNSYQPIKAVVDPASLQVTDYLANFDREEIIYSFKDNKKLVSSYQNSPNYSDIKNDFVVWGVRRVGDVELPIRYHLAIDYKMPVAANENVDWREKMYQYVMAGEDKDEEGIDYYKKEMLAEWRKLYDGSNWLPQVQNDPRSLDFFIDFIDENSELGKYSVGSIGRRTYAETNTDCVCVFNKEIPDVIFVETLEEQEELLKTNEYRVVSVAQQGLFDLMEVSADIWSCFDRIRELLYEHVTLNDSITISCLPIYWLEPNRKIEVEDDKTHIYGEYMIKSFSIPLTHNGLMTLQATKALRRI